MPIAGGILVAGSASRCLSSAAGMLRFLARLSGRRRHVRRSCGPGGGGGGGGSASCCGTVNAAGDSGDTRACISSECASIENMAGTSAASTTTTTQTITTMTTGTATTISTTTTTTTTTTRTRIGDKSRFESRTNNDLTMQDSRWTTPLQVSIERLECDRLRESSNYQDESSCSSQEASGESIRRNLRDNDKYLERSLQLSRRLELLQPAERHPDRAAHDEPDKYSSIENVKDNQERVSSTRRLHHRLHYHRNSRHSAVAPPTTASVETTSAAIDSTETATTTTAADALRSGRTRTRLCSGASEQRLLVDEDNSRSREQQRCPLKFHGHSPVFSDDPTIYQNEMQQRPSVDDDRRNVHHPDNSSFSNTSFTRKRTVSPYLATLLIISYTLFGIADACSSRSTPKPRPPTPTPRPNITFHMYTCPPDYAEWYCLNGATCFTVKIQESLLYNCLCANGFIGQRCEFKDLDGSYLPSRQRVMLETASIAGGATIAVFLVVIICIAAYIHCKRKQKELRTSSACVDTVDGPGRDPELRPFSNRSRSLMIFMAKNPNGSSMCPSIEQTRMPGWSDYSRTETARMASVNEEKRGSSQ